MLFKFSLFIYFPPWLATHFKSSRVQLLLSLIILLRSIIKRLEERLNGNRINWHKTSIKSITTAKLIGQTLRLECIFSLVVYISYHPTKHIAKHKRVKKKRSTSTQLITKLNKPIVKSKWKDNEAHFTRLTTDLLQNLNV